MIARTGYIVSVISYVIFLTLDWMRPGFVSNFLSPHVFLLAAIIFGILWSHKSTSKRSTLYPLLSTLSLSILLAIFAWSEGRAFNDWRVLVTLVAFVSPWMVLQQLTHEK